MRIRGKDAVAAHIYFIHLHPHHSIYFTLGLRKMSTAVQNILITGANRGVGLALVQAYLSRADTHVYAACRKSSDALMALKADAGNGKLSILQGIEVTDSSSIATHLVPHLPPSIDVVINNAGILFRDSLDELSN